MIVRLLRIDEQGACNGAPAVQRSLWTLEQFDSGDVEQILIDQLEERHLHAIDEQRERRIAALNRRNAAQRDAGHARSQAGLEAQAGDDAAYVVERFNTGGFY